MVALFLLVIMSKKKTIREKYAFIAVSHKFYNDGFIPTSNSEQKKQKNREKVVFYCTVSQIHINLQKTRKKH